MNHDHESEADRERRAGMYQKNDGLGGHHAIDDSHEPSRNNHNNNIDDDYEDYDDDQGHRQRRRRQSRGGSNGGYNGGGRSVIEAPTNVIYEAPQHNTYDTQSQGQDYQGTRKNPMATLIMFLILIAILVFGYMSITGTSFDQLIQMLSGNHTTIIVKTT